MWRTIVHEFQERYMRIEVNRELYCVVGILIGISIGICKQEVWSQ
jgi:hypothetical protein